MRKLLFLLFALFLFSCNNERIIQLPEIENAEITEVLDVSPAYIFYDENLHSSASLNSNNLIGTTNWLVNVDKRLELALVIPHLQYLQNKRRKRTIHKNESANNYFTCNDISMGNLGFLEFTNINFITGKNAQENKTSSCFVFVKSMTDVYLSTAIDYNFKISKSDFKSAVKVMLDEYGESVEIILIINGTLTFQDYISIKEIVEPYKNLMSNNEFIY